MSIITGKLAKLTGELTNPINYTLSLGEEKINLNQLIGRDIAFNFLNKINCIQCDRLTSKSFQQGYCYPCYRKLLACNLCVIHPEKCNFPKVDCPDTWEHNHCKKEHIVYLANSSDLKVGITRATQVPVRWIDQGATQAIPLFKVENRYQSGVIEVKLKQFINDKTNWRVMLSNRIPLYDMTIEKEKLLEKAKAALIELDNMDLALTKVTEPAIDLNYPIKQFPIKCRSINLDKENALNGKLVGVKGQYLLFEGGDVINIRKHAGYQVSLKIDD